MTKEELLKVELPERTKSYPPVSHKVILKTIYKELEKREMEVVSETFKIAREGNQVIGHLNIKSENSDEMGMSLAFRNSYDKSMSIAFVAGSNVWICGNGMVSGDIKFVRKHTGEVLKELKDKVRSAIDELKEVYENTLIFASRTKDILLTQKDMAGLMGVLYLEGIITSTQVSIVKKEIIEPTHEAFKELTLWSFYNHVTFALKESHPTNYFKQHKQFNDFVINEFNLNTNYYG
jgi:hypothetical protein